VSRSLRRSEMRWVISYCWVAESAMDTSPLVPEPLPDSCETARGMLSVQGNHCQQMTHTPPPLQLVAYLNRNFAGRTHGGHCWGWQAKVCQYAGHCIAGVCWWLCRCCCCLMGCTMLGTRGGSKVNAHLAQADGIGSMP
jgi:hypothetical protein